MVNVTVYNISRLKLGYSWANMMVITIRTKGNGFLQRLPSQQFTVNVPEGFDKESEIAGFNGRKDKFALTSSPSYTIGETVD